MHFRTKNIVSKFVMVMKVGIKNYRDDFVLQRNVRLGDDIFLFVR